MRGERGVMMTLKSPREMRHTFQIYFGLSTTADCVSQHDLTGLPPVLGASEETRVLRPAIRGLRAEASDFACLSIVRVEYFG